ncbi:Metallo-hydrolase/oxidoreductase [Aspergillus indologenus CBS 114.80]|uniref:Metallo-hydrolase/oxidoreductase n=1 Tax=Aspergillus indologenus CBS 114.80 TaxID=1450541 RepID=A0A2V5HRZ4_9EURO|nr:Metallo-hydrolase/oxidoreductase [Aspergillus indologenus CBS 114.80]
MTDFGRELPETDAFVDVKLLNGGSMTAHYHKLHAGDPAEEFRMYNWAFYIYHPGQQRHIIWDLGFSSVRRTSQDAADYSPAVAEGPFVEAHFQAPRESIPDQIQRRSGVAADQIQIVIISHAHFDHCRPISRTFVNAVAWFGPGTREFCAPGHLVDPTSFWDGRFFDPEDRATERWQTLPGPWTPFGPFPNALDFLGDGSLWIIQAPGHMPGNLCACARLESGEWILLGSDCCHSRALLDGAKDFARLSLPEGGDFCLHTDLEAARDTVARVRDLKTRRGVHVALAHDTSFIEDGQDPVLLSLLDEEGRAEWAAALREQRPF